MANAKTSKLMTRLEKLKHKPVSVSGYLTDGPDKDTFHLYPAIDPTRYYVIPKDGIVETIPLSGDENDRLTVLIDASIEIECVARETKRASELESCGKKPPCGCQPTDSGERKKVQDAIIQLARLLLSLGILQLDCATWEGQGGIASCCRKFNVLLQVLLEGQTGIGEANQFIDCLPG